LEKAAGDGGFFRYWPSRRTAWTGIEASRPCRTR